MAPQPGKDGRKGQPILIWCTVPNYTPLPPSPLGVSAGCPRHAQLHVADDIADAKIYLHPLYLKKQSF